jgi:hypothetical protein
MVLAPPAPHAPFTPAPEYKDHYKNVKAMRTPNFNIPVFQVSYFCYCRYWNFIYCHDLGVTIDGVWFGEWIY